MEASTLFIFKLILFIYTLVLLTFSRGNAQEITRFSGSLQQSHYQRAQCNVKRNPTPPQHSPPSTNKYCKSTSPTTLPCPLPAPYHPLHNSRFGGKFSYSFGSVTVPERGTVTVYPMGRSSKCVTVFKVMSE